MASEEIKVIETEEEPKKEGILEKGKKFFEEHKKALIAGIAGIATVAVGAVVVANTANSDEWDESDSFEEDPEDYSDEEVELEVDITEETEGTDPVED